MIAHFDLWQECDRMRSEGDRVLFPDWPFRGAAI